MLDAMRRGAQSWVAKALFAVLVVSFAIWGIPHDFLKPGGTALVTIGPVQVTPQDFERAFQNELMVLSSENQRRITADEARQQGVDRFVLDKLIGQAAIREHADQLRLGMSDSLVVEKLKSDESFAGPDGKFSRTGLDGLLRELGISERAFLAIRRDDEIRRQITGAILGATVTPKAAVDIMNNWEREARAIEFVKIDASKVNVAEPDDAKLKAFYEENKSRYMTPAYRKFSTLAVTVDDLKKDVQISDDELKATYAETKATYDRPEKRRIQQIAFKDKAAAEAARKELVDGKKNFLDVAKDAGAKESDVNLGLLTKSQMIDTTIADAAFSLERDSISPVIEGRFATVLLRTIEIQPGKDSSFDEVKDKVRDELARRKAVTLIQERVDLVEEARNAGKTFKEIADSLKITLLNADAAGSDNKKPDGTTSIEHPDAAAIVAQAFRSLAGI